MVTIQVKNLIDFVAEVFSRSESSPEEARRIATYLTTANLTGHDSHGVIRVPLYVSWQKAGSVVPDQVAEVVVDTPSLAVIDGKFGYGQTVTPQAVRIGIDKCKKAGLAAIALRNAGHIGRVGDWAGGKLYDGGKWVVNPSGGLISKGHPLGATGLAQCSELTWQLRGDADKRQVEGAKVGLQHNIGIGGAVVVTMYRPAANGH